MKLGQLAFFGHSMLACGLPPSEVRRRILLSTKRLILRTHACLLLCSQDQLFLFAFVARGPDGLSHLPAVALLPAGELFCVRPWTESGPAGDVPPSPSPHEPKDSCTLLIGR